MRRLVDRSFRLAAAVCALLACAVLLGIAGTILWRGLPALSWSFLTAGAGDSLAAGGILYQSLGTLVLVTTALLVSVPLAAALALVQAVYLRSPRAQRLLTLVLYSLNGVPSILLGIFGLILFTRLLGWGKSWLGGGLLLAMMILPTVTVSLLERIQALPRRYLEAAAGLGLRRSQIVWSVILPQSVNGLVSGALLGLARAAGETAPILFTAAVFSGVTLPRGIQESPVLALPYHIFVLAQDSLNPAAQPQLWGAAFVLLGLVFGLSLLALPARLRLHEEARHG